MAYATSITKSTVHGDERVNHGTFTLTGGATTALISHGLTKVEDIYLTSYGTAATHYLTTDLSAGSTSSTVGITFSTANMTGNFIAFGK